MPGLRVGHATDAVGLTGVTVVLTGPEGAVAGVDVRGSAPGTRETDLLRPTATVQRVHAICLCGGSAFGLAAADGVMGYLAQRGIGVETGVARVPIVPAAVIFDLALGDPAARPGPELGRAACLDADRRAAEGVGIDEGSVGAGTGATVGKLAGPGAAMKGGLGTASLRLADGTTVGALVVTNAVGDVVDAQGRILAGACGPDGAFLGAEGLVLGAATDPELSRFGQTTLAVLATDARLDKAGCQKLAEVGQDALARWIRPVHTAFDGDTVFALSTGERSVEMLVLGVAAVTVLGQAIERSVRLAEGRGGIPGLADRPAGEGVS